MNFIRPKKLIEQSIEKLKAQAEVDSELLAYQAKMENMLSEYGRLFLIHPPSEKIIQQLAESLIDSLSVTACRIEISTLPDIGISTYFSSGRRQEWFPPPSLGNTGDILGIV